MKYLIYAVIVLLIALGVSEALADRKGNDAPYYRNDAQEFNQYPKE